MGSTNKTTNLELNDWIGTDRIERVDFTTDNWTIDALFDATNGHDHNGAGKGKKIPWEAISNPPVLSTTPEAIDAVRNGGNTPKIMAGTLAARPAADTAGAGTLYWVTDTNRMFRSTGATWVAQGFALECRTSDPISPAVGDIWLRTDL